MFAMTNMFNQPLAAWDVSQVTDMAVRGHPLGSREGGGGCGCRRACDCTVQQMFSCFQYHSSDPHSHFNQPVDSWDVSRVTNMQVREPSSAGAPFIA